MFLTCLKKELFQHMLTWRYALVSGLFVCLILAATAIRADSYYRLCRDYEAASPEHMRVLRQAERDAQSRGLGITIEQAPNPLSIFAAGLENEMTRSYRISSWSDPRTGDRKLAIPSFRYLMTLDVVLVVNIVSSLLALLLVFDSISGEREQGTLKVLLSGPVPRDALVLAKMCAGIATLAVPLVVSWTLSLMYTVAVAGVRFSGVQLMRLGWCAAFSLLYVFVFFAAGMAVSCLVRRSATSLAFCLFGWVFLVLAVPNLVPMVTRHLSPIPARAKMLLERDAISRVIDDELMPAWREELRAQGKDLGSEEAGNELYRRFRQERYRRLDALDRFYNGEIAAQLSLTLAVSRFSPSASYVFASTHLAQTGVRDFLRLLEEVDEYQREFLEAQEKQGRDSDKDLVAMHRKLGKIYNPYNVDNYPVFRPCGIALADAVNDCWVDIVLLAGGAVALFLVAFVGFIRYDPT